MKQRLLGLIPGLVAIAALIGLAGPAVYSQTGVANSATDLAGKILMVADSATGRTVTNLFTFDRGAAVPFAVGASSLKVTNLNADLLDGIDSTGFSTAASLNNLVQGRLTLTSGTAVTTADVTGATSIYFTPYKGNRIALYDGSNWQVVSFSEMTLALGTLTSGLPYDVFINYNSGSPVLASVAWTNGTTRATALVLQDGVLEKSGALTQRYLGTFYTTATTTTEDSFAKRLLWNYYNRVSRPMRVLESTDSWTYTTASFRQANGSTTNQVAAVVGVAEVELVIDVYGLAGGTATVTASVAVGEDSTTAVATGTILHVAQPNAATSGQITNPDAHLRKYPAVGYHFYAWLERSDASGTTTWYGDAGVGYIQSGLHGVTQG